MESEKHILSLLIFLILCSCNNNKDQIIQAKILNKLEQEKLITCPEVSNIKQNNELFLQTIAKCLDLNTINTGYDDLYVRIWVPNTPKNYIINITSNKNEKDCFVVDWNSRKVDSIDYLIVNNVYKDMFPKSGWKVFLDTLNNYIVMNLTSSKPDYDNMNHLTHTSNFSFEVAESNKYRFYELLEPSFYRYVDSNSNNVHQFLKFFNREMNLQVYDVEEKLLIKKE